MKMHAIVLSSLLGCMILCGSAFSGAAETPPSNAAPAKIDFSKEDAARMLLKHQAEIKELLDIAKQPLEEGKATANSSQVVAIELLGEFRTTESVDFLMQNIALFIPRWSTESIPAASYPCVLALINIGTPSISAISQRLNSPVTEKELKLFATVFRLVDGDDLSVARAQLALKEADGLRKKNLEQLVILLKQKQWFF